jgi:energy-coupling factor transporter ATP-binding protein EcfA2
MIDNELDAGVDIDEVRDVISVYQQEDFGKSLKLYNNKTTLVLGLSGAGKSTLCQLLAGNPDLKSENETDSYEFFITDGDATISDSTITSKTFLPTLVPVPKKAVLLDCPGFLDTRSHLHEIATSVFIKNVMEHIKSVKILVVTSHHAVRKGVDRSAFVNLLNNLVGFVKSVENYKNSIALVVNKVENQVNPVTMEHVTDDEIRKQAVAFLNEVRTELNTTEKTSPRVELLNILLSQESGEYRRIGILRRPTQAGTLTGIEAMIDQKTKIEIQLNKSLSYSECDAKDFGMPLSEGARLCIYKTEEILRNDIQERLTILCDTILEYFMKINDSHWSDFCPLLGPKRLKIKQINRLITKIGARNNEDFKVTQLFDWLHVERYELIKVQDELRDIFFDYDFLASVVDTERNDHKKFFSQLASLRKALKNLMGNFKSKCCYCACCFRF